LEFIHKAEKKLETKFSFKIMDHNIEFIGLCKNCQ
jgi:Fe2+ or Zn2+ uptake regulation protein